MSPNHRESILNAEIICVLYPWSENAKRAVIAEENRHLVVDADFGPANNEGANAPTQVATPSSTPVDDITNNGLDPALNNGDITRENTPFSEPKMRKVIQLRFDRPPKNPRMGYVFGRNSKTCDFFMNHQRISNQHFRIHFNENSGTLMITDTSTNGTQVHSKLIRRKSEVLQADRLIGCKSYEFTIVIPRNRNEEAYRANLHRFLAPMQISIMQGFMTPAEPFVQVGKYLKAEEVGRGVFGSVHKLLNGDGDVYVGKRLDLSKRYNEKSIRTEIDILKSTSHVNIVKFVEVIHDTYEKQLWVVMEWVIFGSLTQKLPLQLKTSRSVIRQTLKAMTYLHDQGIVHRDIKPDNILVSSVKPFEIKLADFGLSCKGRDPATFCGTILYVAPEVVAPPAGRSLGKPYTNAVDIWSIGILILELVSGVPAHSKEAFDRIEYMKAVHGLVDYGIDHSSDLSAKVAYQMSRKLLEEDPSKRPSARDCLLDPWMREETDSLRVAGEKRMNGSFDESIQEPMEKKSHMDATESTRSTF